MELKQKYAIILIILLASAIIYSAYVAGKIDNTIEEMTQDQKEMMEFLETWKKCV